MRVLGEICLLAAFVASGFAAFACPAGAARQHRRVRLAGLWAAAVSVLGLSVVTAVLAWALYRKDFAFAYVAQYSSALLPWHYSLSALWVGQSGSLLLWAWLLGLVALVFRCWPPTVALSLRERKSLRLRSAAVLPATSRSPVSRKPVPASRPDAATCHASLRDYAFGVLMGYLCFLTAVMVFAADPMEASLSAVREGDGLSPLLQHPAMLIHPPVVFLGYALWTAPFALATAAVASGRLDVHWVRQARPWALLAWSVLGVGILLGADWAYEELGWGGYWGWDPVENGSLIPWLTGTALIHAMLAWQRVGALKRTAIGLAFATFALCNFATFLTRSGVFSSLHAFSTSPIGWLFLVLMIGLATGGVTGLIMRHSSLASWQTIRSAISREALVLVATVCLLLLAAAAVAGTLSAAVSVLICGQAIMVGPAFYNGVLIPAGLTLLLTTALAPLLRWGQGPSAAQKKWLIGSAGAGGLATAAAVVCGVDHPIGLAVAGLAAFASAAFAGAVIVDGTYGATRRFGRGVLRNLRQGRRQYAGFLVHLGLICLAIGVTGSSLGKREQGFTVTEGETVEWAGRGIRVARVQERKLPDKLVGEAVLEVSRGGRLEATLVPAQHYHLLQEQWTTEVAIQSTWAGDFYAILHSGTEDGKLYLTFVENPLMRWLWLGGAVMVLGAAIQLWPSWGKSARQAGGKTPDGTRKPEPASARQIVPSPLSRAHQRRLRASAKTVKSKEVRRQMWDLRFGI